MPSAAASSGSSGSSSSYSLFPAIPAPLQRLFDLVPLVTYPANALPDDGARDDVADVLPTLYVFSSAADAARGRPSFNPTCLKWQTYLRLAGVPVRLEPSTNHASPSGALPFLLPPRRRAPTAARPVAAHELQAYAREQKRAEQPAGTSLPPGRDDDPRAPAYQALLDTRIRRAWLHAVYLHETAGASIAARLYARAASTSPLVRAALARQLRAAATAEVWGAQGSGGGLPDGHDTVQIYREAQAALQALAVLLEEGGADNKEDDDETDRTDRTEKTEKTEKTDKSESETRRGGPFFFGCHEPTLFDAAVFSYTHLLLEDDDDDSSSPSSSASPSTVRFQWQDRTLPDAVRALPALVQHRARILERCWPELLPGRKTTTTVDTTASALPPSTKPTTAAETPVADSVVWIQL